MEPFDPQNASTWDDQHRAVYETGYSEGGANATQDRLCESCRYWEPLDYEVDPDAGPGPWGMCKMVAPTDGRESRGRTGFESDRAFTSDASGFDSWLTTRADFGCIEHAPAPSS